jgi:hypothetical protein
LIGIFKQQTMTKIFSIAALLFSITFFSACNKDSSSGVVPSISFRSTGGYTYANATVTKGTTVLIGVTAAKAAATDDVLATFTAAKALNGTASTAFFSEPLTGAFSSSYAKDFSITAGNTAGTEKYTFTVTSKGGLTNSVSLTLTVN